ncbi:MAG TPA: hypothetical protein VF678_07725 [bacterium]
MTALRTSVLGCAVLAALLLAPVLSPNVARAEAPMPTLIGSIPIGFDYTHDQNTQGVDNKPATGIQVEYITPWYLGVGIANYKSGIVKNSVPSLGLSDDLMMTYNFIELSANIKWGPVLLAWGYGSGSVSYSPSNNPPGIVKWKNSQAFERFIRLGLLVTPKWSIHLASHALYAEAEQEFGGGKHTGDIGAIMTTAGVGYTF